MAASRQSVRPGRIGRTLLRVVFDQPETSEKPPVPHIRPAQAVLAWRASRHESQPAWQRSLPA